MPSMTQYSNRVIRTWSSHRLGCLYMNSFSFSRDEPEELGQLERIVNVLKLRPFDERLTIYSEIGRHFRNNIREEDYKRAAVLRDMKQYFKNKILD
jgi:hypothetical protein